MTTTTFSNYSTENPSELGWSLLTNMQCISVRCKKLAIVDKWPDISCPDAQDCGERQERVGEGLWRQDDVEFW